MKKTGTPYGGRGLLIRIIYLFVAVIFYFIRKTQNQYSKNKFIALCYHGITDIQATKFRKQIDVISRQKNLPIYHSIKITFDDAFSNIITNVVPAISELNIPITIFVPTNSIGKKPSWLQTVDHPDSNETVMSYTQLQLLSQNPLVTIGSHTANHSRLTQIPPQQLLKELSSSQEKLSRTINTKITELAFPHGDYNDEVLTKAQEVGYKKVYSLDPLVNSTPKNDESFQLIGRFSMSPDAWPIEFQLTIHGAYRWLYNWRKFTRNFSTRIKR